MKTRKILRVTSLIMLLVAVVFVFCALACPTLGRTICIGDFRFGAEQWRFCYKVYAIVMVVMFVSSFIVKDSK